jgi:hypothetical protein
MNIFLIAVLFALMQLYVLSFACTKESTKEKCSQNQMLRWFWRADAHEKSLHLYFSLFIEQIGRGGCCVLFATHKGAVFFVCILYDCWCFYFDEKEGTDKFTIEGQYQLKKKITTIVDADDKNCLAELTVVLKFNQGVRQWPYIIAGVLFFSSFFCTSKRKNR